MLKTQRNSTSDKHASRITRLGLAPTHKYDLQEIMANPLRYVPDDRFRRPTVMNAIIQHDIEVHAGMTLDRDQEQTLFLHLNYARHKMGQVRRRLLRSAKWLEKDAMELLHWNQKQSDARSKISICNMGLVLAMAKPINNCGVEFIDLVGEGNVALLHAIDRFDCSRGFKFSTYACKVIQKAFARLFKKHYRYCKYFPVQLEPTFESDDHLAQLREEDYQDQVGEVRTIMRHNLANLSRTELSVVRDRFSLGHPAGKKMTLKQVGNKMGLSRERIRQIQNGAIAKLRETAEERMVMA